jgi:hypothetical protein
MLWTHQNLLPMEGKVVKPDGVPSTAFVNVQEMMHVLEQGGAEAVGDVSGGELMQNVGVYSQRLQELRDPLIFVNLDVARRRWDFHRAQGDVLQTAVRSVNKRGVELPKVLHLEAILENFPQMSRIDGREWCEPPVFGGRGRKWKCTLCGLRRCLQGSQ